MQEFSQKIKEIFENHSKSKKINFSTGRQGVLQFLFRMSIWEPKRLRSDQWALVGLSGPSGRGQGSRLLCHRTT